MSTDDSISEDASSSGALSHCHASADGDGGKESETSLVSSEGTSASGLAVLEERHAVSQTAGGAVEGRHVDITPACNRIRNLCLSTDEAFEHGKTLPFINPSSLETLRALVQEIQSSGETDPEIWKDCEGRWLHLFQLVEKQYQEQILAQQEQYQCQIQLIQDEIKALVQLQNRQTSSGQPQTEFPAVTKTSPDAKDRIFSIISSERPLPKNVPSDNESLGAPVLTPLSTPSPQPLGLETVNQAEERTTTVLSSGYGTLWETGFEPGVTPDEDGEDGDGGRKHRWTSILQEDMQTTVAEYQQDFSSERPNAVNEPIPSVYQQKTSSGSSQQLTSWAQRQKLRTRKTKSGLSTAQTPDYQELPHSKQSLLEKPDSHDQHRSAVLSPSSFPLRRSDSLMSEASGLTYWRLNECDLYRPLPDSFDSGAYLLLQEASLSLTPSQEPRLSLREIYHNKHKDCKQTDWEGSVTSSPLSPQALTLDPAAGTQQSDRTSGFTSPSHFSSPSFAPPPHPYPRLGTSMTPDSMAEASAHPGDTDCVSDTSSASTAGQPPAKTQSSRGNPSLAVRESSQQRRASALLASEEEGSRSHTSTLKPGAIPGAGKPPSVSPSSLEDPVVLSLLRQNLREKHSRHVADLKAYYESEIQILRDKLKLRDLPQDLEKSNQALTERCKHLEKALAEATGRIQELEATNILLEKHLAAWPERYAVAGAAVSSLQQRLEDSKRSAKEKDGLAARLKSRVRQLEEAAQKACREADDKEARREREYKMLQDLLKEYDSLTKEHEAAKNNLVSAESKLVDANDQISELKRVISKLESQVMQLEHENQARIRYAPHSNAQPSGAGLFHHPDLLLSPSKGKVEPDVTWRRSDQSNGGRNSQPTQTSQSNAHKRSPYPINDQSSVTGSSVDASSSGGSWRCASPPECEQTLPQSRQQEQSAGRRDGSSPLTPIMRALIELEETRATETRAPWVGHQRATVGFVERKHKEPVRKRPDPVLDETEVAKPAGAAATGPDGGGARSRGAADRTAALLRAQRSLSPEGHRSSSLPPAAHRNIPTATPTKRETLLTPLSAMSSPKRCPTENYSTAFGHLMPREEHLIQSDGHADRRRHSFHSSSPRKRLHFTSAEEKGDQEPSGRMEPLDRSVQLGWEQQRDGGGPEQPDPSVDPALLLAPDRTQSLTEAERLFDELTQEKLQIEAALSRMPGAGGRVSLQTRLDEVALENRLERLNRELGSIRMTLKRFHVLRSSAHT
ncbi:M-phase phosphoprotein 9 [Poeciliopsis prolifica]|uniref:M-phase phosphoprotein 9 n=1 Tax=Poeciliopsis prolifica TaxID=188132 RepID=UPI0024133F29|nr:M-phase phosphoprotein 9 [Poeciliopsis prolifica]